MAGVVANAFLGGVISALVLTAVVLLGIVTTFLVSKLLSKTLLKGEVSSFSLELPPFRKPKVGSILIRSLLDRTIFVLGRAVIVAVPAGLVIWILANVNVNSAPILSHIAAFLNPFAKLMGFDGYILTSYILGFPANEIVIPLTIMSYTSGGSLTQIQNLSELSLLFKQNGWTTITAINMLIFTLFHFPCATTCLTIKKETKSFKWVLAAILIPTVLGVITCMITNGFYLLITM